MLFELSLKKKPVRIRGEKEGVAARREWLPEGDVDQAKVASCFPQSLAQ